tara:strand:+ start:2686 stop:3165 length:480 start_codon:yes stop_codon:yes gene_type:complete
MPSIISHGIIGYLLFGKKGLIYGTLPDIIGFIHYFIRLGINCERIPFKRDIIHWVPQSSMTDFDWFMYHISHSLIFWIIIYNITGDKAVYASIFAILMDIFLHDNKVWSGPQFLYPLSQYKYNGIHWLTPLGMGVTISIILILYILPKDKINNFINYLP